MSLLHSDVTTDVLDVDRHAALVADPSAGACVTFTGVIRRHDPEARGEVTGIDYSHHPDAPAVLRRLATQVLAEHDPRGVTRVAVSHRVGHLDVGEVALVCSVSSPHRAEAFTVCGLLVEAIKAGLPIWKHQTEADGRAVWSNLGLEEGA